MTHLFYQNCIRLDTIFLVFRSFKIGGETSSYLSPLDTVDGNQKSGGQHLRLVVYPILYQGFITIPGGCLGFLNHQQYDSPKQIRKMNSWTSPDKCDSVDGRNPKQPPGMYKAS